LAVSKSMAAKSFIRYGFIVAKDRK
jgi:hypothetical protein